MKKSVIKRRKRVVPAANENESALLQQNSFTISPSPQPSHIDSQGIMKPRTGSTIEISPLDSRSNRQSLDTPLPAHSAPVIVTHPNQGQPQYIELHQPRQNRDDQHPRDSSALGVDFTGFQLKSNPTQTTPQPSQQLPPVSTLDPDAWQRLSERDSSQGLPPMPTSRKRSHSFTQKSSPATVASSVEDANRPRLSSISQILNEPQQTSTVEEVAIDPHLSTLPPHLQPQRQPTHHTQQLASATIAQGHIHRVEIGLKAVPAENTSHEYGGKMSRLKREADQMRELLRSKEREIQEMQQDS